MTQRINARRFRAAAAEARVDPRHIPCGSDLVRVLENRPPYTPTMLTGSDTRCWGCDGLIERGHVAFTCKTWADHSPILCYRCGTGWEIYNGRMSPAQAAAIPVFGDPSP